MSIKLLIKEYPYRSIALATTSHALVFRYDPSSESSNGLNSLSSFSSAQDKSSAIPQCMVELSSLSSLDLQEYRPLSHPCRGTLGLINIGGDIFICVVTGSSQVATVRPGERVERIQTVDFRELET